MVTIQQIYQYLDRVAPFDSQEDFDNAGFLVGDQNADVHTVLVALDLTNSVVEEAGQLGAELILTHHPAIFQPLKTLRSDQAVYHLAQRGIHLLSAHTNLDKALGGVNDCLAQEIGLEQIKMLENSDGFGRIGRFSRSMAPRDFAVWVKQKLSAPGLRYTAGSRPVQTVAVLGGSGDFCMDAAIAAGADALVTGEAKHHVLLEALARGFTYVDAGHFATEWPICPKLQAMLQQAFPELTVRLSAQTNSVIYLGEE